MFFFDYWNMWWPGARRKKPRVSFLILYMFSQMIEARQKGRYATQSKEAETDVEELKKMVIKSGPEFK